MAKIAFIGLGNMGSPMAANLCKAQHHVSAFDLSDAAVAQAACISRSVHRRCPVAAHVAAASACAANVQGILSAVTQRRCSLSPGEAFVASGREASYRSM